MRLTSRVLRFPQEALFPGSEVPNSENLFGSEANPGQLLVLTCATHTVWGILVTKLRLSEWPEVGPPKMRWSTGWSAMG